MWATSKSSPSRNTNHRGFTIVELLIVIVVIGILAAITIAAYRGMQQRATTASYTAAVDQWEKILRMEKSLQGDNFTTEVWSCAGQSMDDFPETSVFAEGECIRDNFGGSSTTTYKEEQFKDWTVDRPSAALPTTTIQLGVGYWIKTRGIALSAVPSGYFGAYAVIQWWPQVSGQCGRGSSDWLLNDAFGIKDGTLTGGYCTLSIDSPY